MSKETLVKELATLIANEKRQPKPDRIQMRFWLAQIKRLRREEDFRVTHTGQESKFRMHTSMRTWRDDA